jgi:hypothetical protein
MRFLTVNITHSPMAVYAVEVAPWEVPVLEAVHGQDETVVVDDKDYPRRALPDNVQGEYDRLALKYKKNEGDQTFVSLVYGAGSRGVAALAAEIEKERALDPRTLDEIVAEEEAAVNPLDGLFDDAVVMAEGAVAITE